jgi:hypothetical protein
MEKLGVLLMDLGLGISAAGASALLVPRRVPRRRAAMLLGTGAALVLAASALPARERRSGRPPARIDDFAPVFQFEEFHEIEVDAPPEKVYRAVREVTAGEIRLFQTLTWIRSPRSPRSSRQGGSRCDESILNAPADRPILDVATSSGFLWLAEDTPREVVVGMVVVSSGPERPTSPEAFAALAGPGYAKAVMDFRIEERGDGRCRLTTETRVFATGAARQRFAVYWRLIYPGSALIRRMWLRAIKDRAER